MLIAILLRHPDPDLITITRMNAVHKKLTPGEERAVIWLGIAVPWGLYLIALVGLGWL